MKYKKNIQHTLKVNTTGKITNTMAKSLAKKGMLNRKEKKTKKNNVANVLQAFPLLEHRELHHHPMSFFLKLLKLVQYITSTANISKKKFKYTHS